MANTTQKYNAMMRISAVERTLCVRWGLMWLPYIGFRNSVSTAWSFRGMSAKRRPGGTLCFLFQSKGHTLCKKGINSSDFRVPKSPKFFLIRVNSRLNGSSDHGDSQSFLSLFLVLIFIFATLVTFTLGRRFLHFHLGLVW